MYEYGNEPAYGYGTDGLDGAAMDFFKKHKKKILIGAGVAAAAVGVYFLTKKSGAAPRRALSGVSRGSKSTVAKRRKKATPRRRKRPEPKIRVQLV